MAGRTEGRMAGRMTDRKEERRWEAGGGARPQCAIQNENHTQDGEETSSLVKRERLPE